ncbi:aldose 1-epimerase family protein [Solitalea koreensis]|uniref:Galactose mutarotase n=1 Tax=Solitalea koreensis TaxID=543615 RepID=A0A521BN25_9SPHI|nr:aldose 1-epimerase family protein [Solitalea koreensis]SMO48544.1 Galactose mutarotase [Solitalea koreensis]
MNFLQNENLTIKVKTRGAELCSIIDNKTGLEYIWEGDPAFWGKHAPILFPIVGKLKNDTYFFNGNEYKMTQHGLARDLDFELSVSTSSSLQFTLKSSAETKKIYPFDFKLDVVFTLNQYILSVTSCVTNTGADEMYFSIGYHPAFKIPLSEQESYDDYSLEFNEVENLKRWNVEGGLIGNEGSQILNQEQKIPLTRKLFEQDAIVLKRLASDEINIKSSIGNHGVTFRFKDFPYFGIWSKTGADFVCLEPWQGIADKVDTNQNLTEKEGIIKLFANEQFQCGYSVLVF